MDATQQIEDSFFGEGDDSDNEDNQAEGKSEREPLAVLRIFKNNHIPETEVPLYQGENVLGRDPTSCSVPLQARSVSGHHAIISITVFGPNDHRAHTEVTETLLWDLGSLNGTRKGRFKLTPHVRYALNDGDGVVLADLPCQYVSLKKAEKNAPTPTGEKARGQMSSSSSAEGETVKGVETSAKKSTLPPVPVWSDETKKSLQQLQMTPKQPETTLVPESDSDSDGEKHGQRDRRRIVASDSVSSDFSSPTCSTFLTSATKIIPESEDESAITPSSTLKGRFQKAGNDTEVSSSSSKPDPLHFNLDSDTDVEDDDEEMSKTTSRTAAVAPAEASAVNPADLHMDSDTDAEEEEMENVKSDPESSGLAPAKPDLLNPAALNMDSDTDVEEDEPVKPNAVPSSGPVVLEEKKDGVSSTQFHLENDTDVEDEEEVSHIQDIRPRPVAEFNMNNDTDVEDEEEATEALVQPCKTDKHLPDAKMLSPESDSDTDVEGDDVTHIRTPTVAKDTGNSETAAPPHESSIGACEVLRDEFRLDSDTDVEEDGDKMEEKEQKCTEAAIQIVHSSTPIGAGLSEEEMETQAFLGPSQMFKRPGVPSLLHPLVSPGGVSHTDEDFAVAETQSFMCDAAQAESTLDETPQLLDEPQRSGGAPSFQLDLSDSSVNQMTEAEEHNRKPAEEDWQLQATQLYAMKNLEGSPKAGTTPLDLDATQAFTDSISLEEKEDGRKEEKEEETQPQAAPSHSSIHTETQLIKPRAQNKHPSESNVKIGAGEPESKDEEDEIQADSHLSTADTLLIIRSPRQEEQTQPYAFLAANIQEEIEKEEHGSRDGKVQQEGEGQRAQNGMVGHENNVERQIKEHEPMVTDAKNDITRAGPEDEKKENDKEESENKVDEAGTQPAEDDTFVETPPRCEEKDDEEHEEERLNEPSSSKGTWSTQGESAQPIKAKHHTHHAAVAIAETLPMCEEEEEQEEEEIILKTSQRPGGRRQTAQVKPIYSVESDKVAHVTIVETLPLSEEDNERQEEQSEVMSTKRSSMRRQNIKAKFDECHVTIPETQPMCDEEDGQEEEEPQSVAKSFRKSRRGNQTAIVEATQPLDVVFAAETLKTVEKKDETDGRKSLRGRAASGKGRGRGKAAAEKDKTGKTEQEENCEEEVDEENKGRGRKNLRQTSKNNDKARLGLAEAEHQELEGLNKKEDEEESKRLQETKDQLEREKSMSLEKERKEREEEERREQEEKDRLERERIDQEKKAREEKEQFERENELEKERREQEEKDRLEQERTERQNKEKDEKERLEKEKQEEKENLEKKKQEEKDRLAREKRDREETEIRKEKETQENEMEQKGNEIQGNDDGVEKELRRALGRRKSVRKRGETKKEEEQYKEKEEGQELGKEQKKGYKGSSKQQEQEEQAEIDEKPRRGRRTARKYVSPPAGVEDEGGPAKRTRSRSNSSNSVCSEQSTQDSLNEGRRRGRRTTTVIPSEKGDSKQAAHSRSNSISSERSTDSVATQSRGRGAKRRKSVKVEELEEEKEEKRKQLTTLGRGRGRGRGRGGKQPGTIELKADAAGETETEEAKISPVAAEDSVISQSSTRGRKRGSDISKEETPQPIPKTPRRSIAGPTHKVLFTGVADEDGEKLVVRLGGALAKGVSDMTHLVTDKVRRTVKFLCAVARGVPIVTPDWLSKCGKEGSFLSPNGFLVKDVEQEKRFNFSLQDALRVASSQPLLQGYEIHVTPSVKPEPTQMKEIITCCGARFLPKMPSAYKAQVVVISCEEDRALCERAQSLSFPVVSAEFLLTGILQQKVDVQTHALFLSPTATVPKTNTRRRGK